jgi:protein-L-isoaspartate(D-aspartate) O-methyltransferase
MEQQRSRRNYMLRLDGTQLPQTTRPELVHEMLEQLRVEPGQRVLEIGTGSGYSTALLCDLVGRDGLVVSLDVDPEMVERAAALLADDGLVQAEVVLADGRDGWPAGAPYDRVIAWGAIEELPDAWVAQAPDGVIVAPRDGFIPLNEVPLKPWED